MSRKGDGNTGIGAQWRGTVSFTFFDHTGDVGVRLAGRAPGDLFEAAAAALTETITDPARIEPRESVALSLESSSLDLLLVDWLDEILYRFEVNQFLVGAVEVHVDRRNPGGERPDAFAAQVAWAMHATLRGERFDPRRHGIKVLVKAVTYHALEVREEADGWHGTVIFDV